MLFIKIELFGEKFNFQIKGENTMENVLEIPFQFIFAFISRHFIGLSKYFIWWMEIKRIVVKNPYKCNIKIQFLEFAEKFK